MLSQFNNKEEFHAGDGYRYRICSYILNSDYLQQHQEIITQPKASMIDYRTSGDCSLEGISEWVSNASSSENTHLLGIYDVQTDRLVGTSKVIHNHPENSFSAGILISPGLMGSANLGRYIKGYILNKCFLELDLKRCDGGCRKENIPCISIYKYFRFTAGYDGKDFLRFTLSRESFYTFLAKIFRRELTDAGFDPKGLNDSSLIESEIVSLRGYSSLSFMNLAARLMECKKDLEIIEIFDCETISEISLAMGASLFSLVQG